ncbi:MAG: SsrA-binding protein [Candidatus Wolfebacteria bacterium GW2011_GWC1_43_10]|uniref:SsrA-binding protein n=2 Tax=Candidatus Wolfeibacteriota TaxID=1752735 RepID=A0A0G1C9V0_9BACT|nr:MAG: SsrA-binding protein [Candidatus Wolfebacteria bacterium GW2011_GWC1_43_10]KKT22419.1 MAG: SsrA-binding protein [Parcubacteria group bacterium GW2011_GWB1_43_8b]OGM89322.1 MAG: SsrA-binding protein [Candidatus Wolfebacteria bacterium GWA1_42_9]
MSLAENKKAFFDYQILEKFEAGLELRGFEVKAIRAGKAALAGAYVKIYNNEGWLVGASIHPFQKKNAPQDYDENRSRRLLLHKNEIKHLIGKSREKGLTIVPIKLYNKGGKIKIEIGIARGKTKSDKREKIKQRDSKREINRRLKS